MKNIKVLLLFVFAGMLLATAPSCKAKYGCPSNELVKLGVNKRGEMKAGRNKNRSELFDKKTRKRMGH